MVSASHMVVINRDGTIPVAPPGSYRANLIYMLMSLT